VIQFFEIKKITTSLDSKIRMISCKESVQTICASKMLIKLEHMRCYDEMLIRSAWN